MSKLWVEEWKKKWIDRANLAEKVAEAQKSGKNHCHVEWLL